MSTWRAYAALAGAAFCMAGCDGALTSSSDPSLDTAIKAVGPGGPHPLDHLNSPSGNPHGPGAGATTMVHVCHRTGQSGVTMTLLIPPSAVAAHLAHGDKLGRCGESFCSQKDFDGDGVNNCVDACLDTLAGQAVDGRGCPILMLQVDAGPDWSVTAGDMVAVEATVEVVQGPGSVDNMVWSWEQVGGPPAPFQASGASFVLDTTGQAGGLTFRVTASDDGGLASANDALVIDVEAVSAVHLAAGKWHNAAMFSNGRLRTWGLNSDGQLGNGTSNDAVDVDTNAQHTVVARDDGTAWTFGSDALNNSAVPVQVPGAWDVSMVAAMVRGAFLLQSTGDLLGFTAPGGECVLGGVASVDGNGATTAIDVAVAPPNLVDIATGGAHVVALDAGGTAWVWGSRFGCSPRAVLTNVTAIAAGDTDLCLFVRGDGTAWGLGYNLHGQLGNGGTVSNYTTPRLVSGLTDVVQVAAGERHSLFVTGDGSLFAAGWNRYCQLGLEDEPAPADPQFGVAVLTPVQVQLSDVVLVAGGDLHTVAVTGDGKVWGWGLNNVGQLHAGTLSVLPGTVCAPMEIELD